METCLHSVTWCLMSYPYITFAWYFDLFHESLRMVRVNYNVCDITEANSDLEHYSLNDRLIDRK